MRIIRFVFLICMVTSVASAQDVVLEEIVVTGSRIDVDYYEMPAVTITKKADFLVQSIRLINDSRSPDLRRDRD